MDVKGPAKIVFSDCEDGEKFIRASQTRIFCGGEQLNFISNLTITVEPTDIVRATVDIMPAIEEIDGAAIRARMLNPNSGKFEQVERVVFADGSEITFECE